MQRCDIVDSYFVSKIVNTDLQGVQKWQWLVNDMSCMAVICWLWIRSLTAFVLLKIDATLKSSISLHMYCCVSEVLFKSKLANHKSHAANPHLSSYVPLSVLLLFLFPFFLFGCYGGYMFNHFFTNGMCVE